MNLPEDPEPDPVASAILNKAVHAALEEIKEAHGAHMATMCHQIFQAGNASCLALGTICNVHPGVLLAGVALLYKALDNSADNLTANRRKAKSN